MQLVVNSCLLLLVGHRKVGHAFVWGQAFEFRTTWLMLSEDLSAKEIDMFVESKL